jgi:hypothetical protein
MSPKKVSERCVHRRVYAVLGQPTARAHVELLFTRPKELAMDELWIVRGGFYHRVLSSVLGVEIGVELFI